VRTHYDNLKVLRNASSDEIRIAYRRLSQRHHPDRNPDDPDAARVMSLINRSYQVLSDPVKRATHDRWIREQERIAVFDLEGAVADYADTVSRCSRGGLRHSSWPNWASACGPGARSILVYLLILAFIIPVLATMPPIKGGWPPPVPIDAMSPSKPVSHTPNRWVPPQPPLDIVGTWRLVRSESVLDDGQRMVHSKGKLVITRQAGDAYLVLQAMTVKSAGTFGHPGVYTLRLDWGGGEVLLQRSYTDWIHLSGMTLKKYERGVNFVETSWWEKMPESYGEKYLDRGIREAAEIHDRTDGRASNKGGVPS
jgi:hypothetical protein